MTFEELVKSVWDEFPELQLATIDEASRSLIEAMRQALSQGSRIEIRGFGSFNVKSYAPRKARNPKTGEKVDIGVTYQVHFKPSSSIKSKLEI